MNKVVLITGAARRIGATIAAYLHSFNFNIIIHYNKSYKEAEKLCSVLNNTRENSSIFLQSSLYSKDCIESFINDSFNWKNRLDVVINNASIFSKIADKFDDMWNINVKAPYWLSNLSYPYLEKVNGSIINITDSNLRKPIKEYSMYLQTKAALSMQTKSLALEFAPHVRVNAIAPGAILWPEGENSLDLYKQQQIISKILLNKHGNPINIAKAVYSLIDNEFITGQEIYIDGGRTV